MQEVPRPLEVIAHDDQDLLPIGRKKVSSKLSRARMEAYLANVVSGEVPLDDTSAEVIKEYLDAHHARQ
jgi:hypothetical protein